MKKTKMAIIAILSTALLIMGCPNSDEDEDPPKSPDTPVISNLVREPSTSVTPTDTVTVSATVTTKTSKISNVVLQWTLNDEAQSNINMTKSGNVYSAVIPAQAAGSEVNYTVSATNNRSETTTMPTTGSYFYTVVSVPDPPVISDLIRTPTSVTPADKVTVSATVTTTESTISTVVLQWTLGGLEQNDITMTKNANNNVYSAEIPAQAAGSEVNYTVFATNALGETNSTDEQNYTVVSAPSAPIDYTKLKLNEVNGFGPGDTSPEQDPYKFYELINIGDKDIPLEGCKIYYNANSATGETLPTGKGALTWIGSATQIAEAGKLYTLYGRNNPGSFTTGLTAARILIITLESPTGAVLDQCIRAADTGMYAITDKSFSRIPDGTGPFYFTTPTPRNTNGASIDGLTKVPVDPPVISNFSRNLSSVTPSDEVIVSATVTPTTSSGIKNVVLQWTLDGSAQSDIPMTGSGVYSATIPAKVLGSVVTYTVYATNYLEEPADSATHGYTVVSARIEYTNLVLNEISGNNKFVEIYNKGSVDIPLRDVKLQRNDGPTAGGSEWVGAEFDSIPAGGYRIILFNSYTPADLHFNQAYDGWKVDSGMSSNQILKVAIVDPSGTPVSVFIRGENPLPAWQHSTGVTSNTTNTYSRMSDGTWAYADPTPGAENGAKVSDIVSPGYLTAQPVDPPVISSFGRDLLSVTPEDPVTVSATVTNTASTISTVVIKWTLDGSAQSDIPMTGSGNVYSATIPKQVLNSAVKYKVSAANNLEETTVTVDQSYTVTSAPLSIDFTMLKLNEVSGVGTDSEKFYELINTGTQDIPLEGCKIYYNANSATGGTLPTGKGSLTWTGLSSQIIEAGKFYSLIGRDNPAGTSPGSFTTGLTAARILIITLESPTGAVLDECVRAADTGEYNISTKSYSRIPDGTGDFYFTEPSQNVTNGTSTAGLTKVPGRP